MTTSTRISFSSFTIRVGPQFLVLALLVDAAVTGVNGIGYLAGAGVLTTPLGSSTPFFVGIGTFLLLYSLAIVAVARRQPVSEIGVWSAICLNVCWSVVSVIIAAAGALDLTGWGRWWAVLQAVVVLAFAFAQRLGLRQARVEH